jgi:hypothetical protein
MRKEKKRKNRNLQRAARERQARTGERYTVSLRHVQAERELAKAQAGVGAGGGSTKEPDMA